MSDAEESINEYCDEEFDSDEENPKSKDTLHPISIKQGKVYNDNTCTSTVCYSDTSSVYDDGDASIYSSYSLESKPVQDDCQSMNYHSSPIQNAPIHENSLESNADRFQEHTNISVSYILENIENIYLSEQELRLLGLVDEGDRYRLALVGDEKDHRRRRKRRPMSQARINDLSRPRSLFSTSRAVLFSEKLSSVQLKSFCKRMEEKEKVRVTKLERKIAEQNHKQNSNILSCPRCGNTQSYNEKVKNINQCPNPKCKGTNYTRKNNFSMDKFIQRMTKNMRKKEDQIKEIQDQRTNDIRNMQQLHKSAVQLSYERRIMKNLSFLTRMKNDLDKRRRNVEHLGNTAVNTAVRTKKSQRTQQLRIRDQSVRNYQNAKDKCKSKHTLSKQNLFIEEEKLTEEEKLMENSPQKEQPMLRSNWLEEYNSTTDKRSKEEEKCKG